MASIAVLAEYREARLGQVSPKTVREELSLLQRVFNVCLKDWGISLPNNANPVDLVRKPRGDNPRERRLSADEYEVISQVPVFNWAIETAMRRGEIAAMDWKHVDLSLSTVRPGCRPTACHWVGAGTAAGPAVSFAQSADAEAMPVECGPARYR